MNEIELVNHYIELRNIILRVKNISYNISIFEKRFPTLEGMTKEEITTLNQFYLALGFDLEDIVKDWKKAYKKYNAKS